MSLTKVTYSMINGPVVCLTDYGAACDGVTDDYDAIMEAHDNAPVGATILVKGATYFTQPLNFTRQLNWCCPGEGDYFMPNVGAGNDAITITGGVGVGVMRNKINLYSSSASNTCLNGIVVNKYFLSTLDSRVQTKCANFAFKVIGALESRFYLRHTVNQPAIVGLGLGFAVNHLKLEPELSPTLYACNANEFYVDFAGRQSGILIDDMLNQGDNVFYGTVQGLTGTPISATNCTNMSIENMHFEGNATVGAFTGCVNLLVKNVLNATSGVWDFNGCINTTIQNYTGGYNIYSNSRNTTVINARLDGDTAVDSSATTEYVGGGPTTSSSAVVLPGGGAAPIANFFQNPFVDIWSAGTSAAPDGFSAVSATFAQETSTVYELNPSAKAVIVTSTATSLANTARATAAGTYASTTGGRWVSIFTPVYVATGQPDLIVYVFDGSTYRGVAAVTTKDAWVPIYGSVYVNGTVSVVYVPYNSGVVSGNFFVGGVSIVNGTSAPRFLLDDGRRSEYIVTNVTYTPAFVGQRAYLSSTGKWYMAKGTASAADWIILN